MTNTTFMWVTTEVPLFKMILNPYLVVPTAEREKKKKYIGFGQKNDNGPVGRAQM